ncbi:MAG TPA: histidine phosphatase family protein [Syntrophorhabdaceae bacterium]|jgi:broad specificity phosphatase PhoE
MQSNPTRLFLVRHGDTVDEETKKVFKGSLDIPLSERGRGRIEKAGAFLSRFNIDYIYTSALSRCIESGTIIARPHGLPIETSGGLNELCFGSWEGLSFDEIDAHYPEEFSRWLSDPELHAPPAGETLRQAQQRIIPAFDTIVERHKGRNLALVAHGGALRIILCSLLDLKLSFLFRLAQDYGGVSIIDIYEDKNAVVKLLNYTFYE